jgi:hypothetical protein
MKVFIRHQTTHSFYTDGVSWTPDRRLARDFKTTLAALQQCSLEHLEDVTILLAFDDHRMDINLPVSNHSPPTKDQPRHAQNER